MRRVFFDVSDLRIFLSGRTTVSGIQRVVLMLIEGAIERLGAEQVHLAFLDCKSHRLQCIPVLPNSAGEMNVIDAILASLRDVRQADHGLARYHGRPLRMRFHKFRYEVHAFLKHERFFLNRKTTLAAWRGTARPTFVAPTPLSKVARPDDILFIGDAVWNNPRHGPYTIAAKQGMRISVLIHDLIPILFPQFFTGDHPLEFHDWLRRSAAYVHGYIANSNATARDLRDFLATYDLGNQVSTVPLARERMALAPVKRRKLTRDLRYAMLRDSAAVPDDVRALTKRSFVLCVGTREIRKNLWAVAQVWQRLAARDMPGLPILVVAGRRGNLNEDFETAMEASAGLGGWIRIVDGPSDRALDFLYRNCEFTITASFYEGWGLPIGESLAYGKTAVVSNTSSMPEVGGDCVEYCDPHSMQSIEAAVLRLIEDREHRRKLEARIAETDLRRWNDVADDLLDTLVGSDESPLVRVERDQIESLESKARSVSPADAAG